MINIDKTTMMLTKKVKTILTKMRFVNDNKHSKYLICKKSLDKARTTRLNLQCCVVSITF